MWPTGVTLTGRFSVDVVENEKIINLITTA
jgi:hypothetical protein